MSEPLGDEVVIEQVDVVVVLGSDSDAGVVTGSNIKEIFEKCGITVQYVVCSAHRNGHVDEDKVNRLVLACRKAGVKFIIAIAGKSAILPGVLASKSPEDLIVWGVPGKGKTERDTEAAISAMLDVPEGVAVNVCGIGSSGLTGCATMIARLRPDIRSGIVVYFREARDKKPFINNFDPWAVPAAS